MWTDTVGRRVPGTGPLDAKIVLLGEAPGVEEERQGAPFVGLSGKFLFDELGKLGVRREDVRVENTVETKPLDNEFWRLEPVTVEKARGALGRRFDVLRDPRVVVPLGNVALGAVRGSPLPTKKKGGWRTKKVQGKVTIDWPDKIGQWRGSASQVDLAGRSVWMIPTYHPAYVLRNADIYPVWKGDLEKIVRAASGDLVAYPQPTHLVGPTVNDLEVFGWKIDAEWDRLGNEAVLAIDIETAGPVIDCIGFAISAEESITVGLRPHYWADPEDLRQAWRYVKRWLRSEIPKAFHYGVFDTYFLWRVCGVRPRKWWWDSQHLHHLLDPRDRHSLAYCASRDLVVPYWKDEAKEEGA